MAAPKGNQFWNNRSKHGRDKLFKTPQLMWEAACEYFEWANKNPWIVNEVVKSGPEAGKILKVPAGRPYTLIALCMYLDASAGYFRAFKSTMNAKPEAELTETDKEFLSVISRIEETIYNQKFEGAALNVFNGNIISRDLGLTDRRDITTDGEKIAPTIITLPNGEQIDLG